MVCERREPRDRLDRIVKGGKEMLDFDIFCLKLRRWELHRELEESGIYIPNVVQENDKKLYRELTEGMAVVMRTSSIGMPVRIVSISIHRRGKK